MREWMVASLLVAGTAFVILSAVGVIRMPDLYTRMQAATKASSLGIALIILAACLHFRDLGVTTQGLLVIAFLWITSPIAAQILCRTAYLVNVPLWESTVIDELASHESGIEGVPESGKHAATDQGDLSGES
ncbi:MAG: monovalent cation/H(+) antiporter subunit G [Planctomycetales bacterium]|nr:monovalent cation/H(+) antiporter subunit G [Planctomycetales bacterium]